MLNVLRKRRDEEEGFTLIELMVVVLIIAILIAIAIPTFLGARERSQDRAAQSDLRNALTAQKTHYVDEEVYTASVTDLDAIEPSLGWQTATVTDNGQVQVLVSSDGTVVCMNAQSASGTVFAIKDISTGTNAGTWYDDGAIATCDTGTTGFASEW